MVTLSIREATVLACFLPRSLGTAGRVTDRFLRRHFFPRRTCTEVSDTLNLLLTKGLIRRKGKRTWYLHGWRPVLATAWMLTAKGERIRLGLLRLVQLANETS